MENTIQSDLIRGHINTIILKALFDGDRYGYDIVREIEQKSSGQYKLKQPTLYSCLKRLEIQGFIRSYWGAKSNGGRRKYFTLTDMGRELFIKNQHEWEYSRTVIDKLISDREFDLSAASPVYNNNAAMDEESEEEISEQFEDKQTEEITESENLSENSNQENIEDNFKDDSAPDKKELEIEVTSQSVEFSDTSAIMNELFRRQMDAEINVSYADKLIAEKYVSDRTDTGLSSNEYFRDFFDENENISDTEIAETYEKDFAVHDENENKPEVFQTQQETASSRQHTSISNIFLDYHTATVIPQNGISIIEREYRNILGQFLNACFVEPPRPIAQEQDKSAEIYNTEEDETSEYENNVAENFEESEEESLSDEIQSYTNDVEVNRKLHKITGEVREMGDNVVIRTHNNASYKEYSNTYYYYSNKLMTVHYGILFAIMMIEVLFSAVFVSLVLHEGRSTDKWFYIIAGVISVVFPIVAFAKNFTEPDKRKRINFSLKNSLIYRLIVMAQCFLIIYCLNIIAGMPLGFDGEYLTTVLLPALLCTNFPVSALIFNALYKTKKFAVEQ